MASILLITPDRSFEDYALQVLSSAGHHVVTATDADEAVRAVISIPVDLAVVDTLSPDLASLREQIDPVRRLPFVFVAPSFLPIGESDRLVRKPASADELRKAVAAVLAGEALGPQVDLGAGLIFDRTGQRIMRDGLSEQLTPIEFRLLDYLASVRGDIASAQDLLEHVWHYTQATASSEVVRSHLKNLRVKIRRVNAGQDIVETIPRRGYRLR
jgi:DNA-binding response OmpR family regulator